VPPLHVTPLSCDTLHTSPHAPQLPVLVFVLTHWPLHIVSRQVHDPAEQSGFGCMHVA